MYVYKHVTIINEKETMGKTVMSGIWKFWSEEREGGNNIIIIFKM